MNSAAPTSASVTTEFINAVIIATKDIFETMLDCSSVRTGLMLKESMREDYALSAVIGVTAKAIGTVVVS